MKKIKKAVALILAFVIVAMPCMASAYIETPGETSARYIKAIINKIAEEYRFEADKTKMYEAVLDYVMNEHPDMLEGAIQAVTDTLDAHSDYFTQEEMTQFLSSVESAYVGIGVTVQKHDEGLVVTEVNPIGGAFEAGVLAGDIICDVNGQSIAGFSLDEATVLIRGEAGTTVDIKIKRDGNEILLTVERRKLYVETVGYTIEDGGVGYIYISEFAPGTPISVKEALDVFSKEGISKMIIDVRDNPGGTLSSVVDVLEYFVPKGKTITTIEYNNERYNSTIKSAAKFTLKPKREIVVLANENSASAAELFSGVMQNLKLAKVVGKTTYGKGSMQEFLGLINPEGFSLGDIKLSVAEFTLPDGGKINGLGIEPDVYVKNVMIPYDDSVLTPLMSYDKYRVGSEADDVLAIEERLSVLGYFVGTVDEVFDSFTETAVSKFQADVGLFSYGVMDYTTQQALENEIKKLEMEEDRQFDKAYEMLTKE